MIARVPDLLSPRAPRFDRRDARRYSLALDTFARARVFVAREPVALASAQFLRAAAEQGFEILTYCFMPDRAHLLVEALDRDGDAGVFVARLRQCSSPRDAWGGALWRRGAVVCLLRDTAHACTASRNILEHPVRAGLVARACDYPYSGSFAWDRQALLAGPR